MTAFKLSTVQEAAKALRDALKSVNSGVPDSGFTKVFVRYAYPDFPALFLVLIDAVRRAQEDPALSEKEVTDNKTQAPGAEIDYTWHRCEEALHQIERDLVGGKSVEISPMRVNMVAALAEDDFTLRV